MRGVCALRALVFGICNVVPHVQINISDFVIGERSITTRFEEII